MKKLLIIYFILLATMLSGQKKYKIIATKKNILTTIEFDSNILNYQFGNSGKNFQNVSNFGKFLTFEPTAGNYETNLVVRTERNYYIFLLTPVSRIAKKKVPDMHIQVSVKAGKVILTQGEVGSTIDNSISFGLNKLKSYNEKISYLRNKTKILDKESSATFLNNIQNNLIISAKNVLNTESQSYLVFTLKNCSNQNYKIGNFDLYTKKIIHHIISKNDVVFNRQADIVSSIYLEKIKPGETKTIIIGYSSFAVGEQTVFNLIIREKGGNRNIEMQFPPQQIFETL